MNKTLAQFKEELKNKLDREAKWKMYYLTESNEIVSDEEKSNMNVKCYNSYITCVEKKGGLVWIHFTNLQTKWKRRLYQSMWGK